MNIHIVHYAQGAASARGLAVVIDVFRAFSVACYAFDRGAHRILATRSEEKAREIKRRHPDYLLMGERHGEKLPGFDLGNSPSEIAETDLRGKTLIHTTHAGTRALLAARRAADVLTGSFVNAGAVARYVRRAEFNDVHLVCAGFKGESEATEDTLCAAHIKNLILGRKADFEGVADRLKTAPSAMRFFDPSDPHSPEIDFHMCMELDRFDFIVRRTEADADVCSLQARIQNSA